MQVLNPKILDLNVTVTETGKMLVRLIGERIELRILPGAGLMNVRADQGQIEQVILNLAVNARDAMPGGGQLTLKTSVVDVDKSYSHQHPALQPGRYVLLTVADTGVGMDTKTQERIFEPFFTTKQLGKGTGLGLAIVYGIVKQTGGWIWVYSEPGQGTTFKVYLPQVSEVAYPAEQEEPHPAPLRGTETVLLAEDQGSIRELIRESLESNGYKVLAANDGLEALQIAERYEAAIDLLITDVVMPRMSGYELAQRLMRARPETRAVFMSGYAEHRDSERDTIHLSVCLQKPFSISILLHKVREVLDTRRARPAAGPRPSSHLNSDLRRSVEPKYGLLAALRASPISQASSNCFSIGVPTEAWRTGKEGGLRPVGNEVTEKKHQIRRTLGEAAHKVREPVGAIGNVDAEAIAFSGQLLLQIRADSVQHLKFELVAADLFLSREILGGPNHSGIVSGDSVVNPARQQDLHELHVVSVDVCLLGEGNLRRLAVGALAQADAAAELDKIVNVPLGPVEVSLHHGADVGQPGANALDDIDGPLGERGTFHVDAHKIRMARGVRDDAVEQFLAKRNTQVQAELRQLQRHVGVEVFLRDAVENGQVVLGASTSARFVCDILAQQIETGRLQGVVHGSRRFDGIVERFAGDKPPRNTPAEAVLHDQRRQAFAFGKVQEEGTKRMKWRESG
jgi:CheY-like chemotaxis protein